MTIGWHGGIEENLSRDENIAAAKEEVLKVFKEAADDAIDGMEVALINTVAPVVAKAVEQALKKVL